MGHPPLAADHIDTPHREAALGDLELESGEAIEDYRQSYVTHGELAGDGANAVLVCSALTGTHHRLDFLIGPGRALDPARWFVIATDAIGNGLSTSPSTSTRQPRMRFPAYTIRDMIGAQHRMLTEHLGVKRLHAVVGASMGGMQALQWGVSHPGFMQRLVAMTPMAKTTAWSLMVTRTARECLMADPAWTGSGFDAIPERGWRAYASLMTAMLMRSPQALAAAIASPADADAWQAKAIAQIRHGGFDAHDYLYQSRAYDAHDVGTTRGFGGDTARALASIRAATLLLAPALDLFNPSDDARHAASVIPDASFVEIPSVQGHQSATSLEARDAAFLNATVARFLAA